MSEGLSIESVLNLDVRKATEEAKKFASKPLKLNLIIPTEDIFKELDRVRINPIKVKVDRTEIDTAIASLERLNNTVKVSSAKVQASIDTKVNHIVKFDTLKYDSIVAKTVKDTSRELKKELQYLNKNVRQLRPNKLASLLGFIGKTATAPLRLAGKVGTAGIENIFTGFTESIGRTFYEGFKPEKNIKNFARKIKIGVKRIDQYLIGKEQVVETLLSELLRSGDINKASSVAFDRTKLKRELDKLEQLKNVALDPTKLFDVLEENPQIKAIYQQIENTVTGGKKPSKSQRQVIFKKLLDELRPKKVIDGIVNPLIEEISPLLRFIQGMQAYRTNVKAQEFYNERKAGFPILSEDIVNVIGGAQFAEGQGGRKVAVGLEAITPDLRFIPVENPETDKARVPSLQETAFLDLMKQFAPDLVNNKDLVNTVTNAFKQISFALDPTAYSTAAAQAIANTRLAQEQGRKASTISYSLGGAEAFRYGQAAEYAGIKNTKTLALAYPFLDLAKNAPTNFQSSLLSGDPLNFPYQLGLGGKTPQQQNIIESPLAGASAHAYKHLFKNIEFLDLYLKTLDQEMANISPRQASTIANFGGNLYELLGAAKQVESLIKTGGFDLNSPFKGFAERTTGVEVFSKLGEAKRLINTGKASNSPQMKQLTQELEVYFDSIQQQVVKKFKELGVNLPKNSEDFTGFLKYTKEIQTINKTLLAFRSGKLPSNADSDAYFSGNLDPKEVERRLPVLQNETIKWFQGDEAKQFGTYQDKIVKAYQEVEKIALEFIKNNGKLSDVTLANIKQFPVETFPDEVNALLNKQLDTMLLPSEEQSRVLQVDVPEAFKKTQAAILAYNKLLNSLTSDVLPEIQKLQKVAYGMSGAAALLSDQLVYKTDLDPAGAQKIASEQEIKAYEKLQGRLSPLLYQAIPGEALVTERTKGRPLKEILDRIAKPYKELQRQREELNDKLSLTEDDAEINKLQQEVREISRKAQREKTRFNKAATILYTQLGRLGSALQEMGVVHNDLASGNVFFSQGGPQAIDLGNSQVLPKRGGTTQKIMDQVTAQQRALIDRDYYGLLDPLKVIPAITQGYSNPLPIPEARTIDKSLLNPEVKGKEIPLGSYTKTLLKQVVGDIQGVPAKQKTDLKLSQERQEKLSKTLTPVLQDLVTALQKLNQRESIPAPTKPKNIEIVSETIDKPRNIKIDTETPLTLPITIKESEAVTVGQKIGNAVSNTVANKINEKLLIDRRGDITPDKGQIVKLSDITPSQAITVAMRDAATAITVAQKGAIAVNQGFNATVSALMPVISTLYKLDQGAKGFIKAIDPTGLSGLAIKGAETLLPAVGFSMIAGGTPIGQALGGAVGSVVHPLLGAGGDAIASGLSGSIGSSLTTVPLVGNQIGAAFNQGIIEATGTVVNALSGISTDIATNVLGGQALKTLATKALNPANEEKLRALPQATQDVVDHAVSMGNAMRREANKLLAASSPDDAAKAVRAINSYLELTYLALQEAKLETKALPGSRKKGSLYNETKFLQGELTQDLNKIRTIYPEIVDVNTPEFSVSKQALDAYEKEALRVSIRVREILEKGGDLTKVPSDILEGFRAGLKNGEGGLTKTAIALAKILPDNVKKTLGIASPSKVFIAIAKNILNTIIDTAKKGTPLLIDAGYGIGKALDQGFRKYKPTTRELAQSRLNQEQLKINTQERLEGLRFKGLQFINKLDPLNKLDPQLTEQLNNLESQLRQSSSKTKRSSSNLSFTNRRRLVKIIRGLDELENRFYDIEGNIDSVINAFRNPPRIDKDKIVNGAIKTFTVIDKTFSNIIEGNIDSVINAFRNPPSIDKDKIVNGVIKTFTVIDKTFSNIVDLGLDIPGYLSRRKQRKGSLAINELLKASNLPSVVIPDGITEKFIQNVQGSVKDTFKGITEQVDKFFARVKVIGQSTSNNAIQAISTPKPIDTSTQITSFANQLKQFQDANNKRVANYYKQLEEARDKIYFSRTKVDYSQFLTNKTGAIETSAESLRKGVAGFINEIRRTNEKINFSRDLFKQDVLFKANQLQPKIEGTRQTLINRIGEGSQAEIERKVIRQDRLNIEAKIYQLKQQSLAASVQQQVLINKEYQELTQVLKTNQQKTKELNEQIKQGKLSEQQLIQLYRAQQQLEAAVKSGDAARIASTTRQIQGLRNIINQGNIARDFVQNIRQGINTVAGDFISKLPPPIKKVGGLLKGLAVGVAGYLSSSFFNVYDVIFRLQYAIQGVLRTTEELEGLKIQLQATGGSFEDAIASADKFKTSIRESIKGYTQLSNATKDTSLEGEKTLEILDGINQASRVFGLTTEENNGILLAARQIASDATLQMQDFNQLAERIPGAMNIAARAMGVSITEFRKLNREGVFTTEEFLPKFARQLKLETQATVGQAVQTTQALREELKNQAFLLQAAVGEEFSGQIQTTIKGLTAIAKAAQSAIPVVIGIGKALGLIAGITLIQKIPLIIGFFQNLGITAPLVASALAGVAAQAGKFFSAFAINIPRMATEIRGGLVEGLARLPYLFEGIRNGGVGSFGLVKRAIHGTHKAVIGLVNALGPLLIVGVGIDAIAKLWNENTKATKEAKEALREYEEQLTKVLELSEKEPQRTSVDINQEQFREDLSLYTKISDPFVAIASLGSNAIKNLPKVVDPNAWGQVGKIVAKQFTQPIGQSLKENFDRSAEYYQNNTRTARLERKEIVERQKAQQEINKSYLEFNKIRQQIKAGDEVNPEQIAKTIALLESRNQTLEEAKPVTAAERGDIQSEINDIQSLLEFFNDYQTALNGLSSAYSDVVMARKESIEQAKNEEIKVLQELEEAYLKGGVSQSQYELQKAEATRNQIVAEAQAEQNALNSLREKAIASINENSNQRLNVANLENNTPLINQIEEERRKAIQAIIDGSTEGLGQLVDKAIIEEIEKTEEKVTEVNRKAVLERLKYAKLEKETKIKEAEESAQTRINLAEQERLIAILKLEQEGVIGKEKAEKLKGQATLDRIKLELKAESKKLQAIAELNGKDSIEYQQQQQAKNSKVIELINAEISAQNNLSSSVGGGSDTVEKATNKNIENRKRELDVIKSQLDLVSEVNSKIKELEQARFDFIQATNQGQTSLGELRINQLRRALEIRRQLTSEDSKNLSKEQKQLLEQELSALGINARRGEKAILEEIAKIERDNAQRKLSTLKQEFELKEKLLMLDIKQAEIQARQQILEAQKAVIDAKESVKNAESTKERDIAREELEIAKQQLSLAQENQASLREINNLKEQQLETEKAIALQTEKTNQSANDYKTRGEIAEANRDEIAVLKEQEKQRIKEAKDKARTDKDARANLKDTISQIKEETQSSIDKIREERKRGNNIVTPNIKSSNVIETSVKQPPPYFRPSVIKGTSNNNNMIDLKGVSQQLEQVLRELKGISKPVITNNINVQESDRSDLIKAVGNRAFDQVARGLRYGY